MTATVRTEHCEGQHVVPIGKRTMVHFGEWQGPKTNVRDIQFRVDVKGREPNTISLGRHQYDGEWIRRGDRLDMEIMVRIPNF